MSDNPQCTGQANTWTVRLHCCMKSHELVPFLIKLQILKADPLSYKLGEATAFPNPLSQKPRCKSPNIQDVVQFISFSHRPLQRVSVYSSIICKPLHACLSYLSFRAVSYIIFQEQNCNFSCSRMQKKYKNVKKKK